MWLGVLPSVEAPLAVCSVALHPWVTTLIVRQYGEEEEAKRRTGAGTRDSGFISWWRVI